MHLCHTVMIVSPVNVLIFVFQGSESSMSEDTGLGSEESSSCECSTAVWPLQLRSFSVGAAWCIT